MQAAGARVDRSWIGAGEERPVSSDVAPPVEGTVRPVEARERPDRPEAAVPPAGAGSDLSDVDAQRDEAEVDLDEDESGDIEESTGGVVVPLRGGSNTGPG